MAMPAHSGIDPVAFHADFRPGKLACVDLASGERLTYADLSARADAAARRIVRAAGRRRGQRIVVLARNSALLTVIAVACSRAGQVFVPLNWRLAAPEVAALLSDCEPALVVADAEFAGLAREALASAGLGAVLAAPEQIAAADAPPAPAVELKPLKPADTCIILYTSGTAGKPKGVMITGDNAVWSSFNFAAVADVHSRSVLLCDAPTFHTVGLIAVTRTALQLGATVLMSDRFMPSTTLQRLTDDGLGVTHYFVVPQMAEALLREPGFAQADLSRLTGLFSGGGPLPLHLIQSCLDRGVLLVNAYGMSETGTSVHNPPDADMILANPGSVGFPAPWIEIRVAGEDGEEAVRGEVGEIWMRGPSVSPGYWRQPEATAASRAAGGWFRTGDLAIRTGTGALRIVDRLKDMYISGGENVYPAEVEAVLRQVEGVLDAAVIGVPDGRWGEAGCAFLETAGPADRIVGLAREACAARLAKFKQPAHFRIVERLPRTGSGKVTKPRLRSMFAADGAAAQGRPAKAAAKPDG